MKICISDCERVTLIENGQKKCVDACPSQLNGSYVYALNESNRTCVVVNNEEQQNVSFKIGETSNIRVLVPDCDQTERKLKNECLPSCNNYYYEQPDGTCD